MIQCVLGLKQQQNSMIFELDIILSLS